jgi:SAM-dependent methyltransferase
MKVVAWARGVPGLGWLLAWTDPLHLARRLLRRAIQQQAHFARGRLLDVGCGSQPYRHVFTQVECYIGMELPGNGNADVWGDAMRLPFRALAFDTVLCNEVLEHVPEPATLMAEVARVLKPGGCLLLTTPQTWGLHHEPHDFYRYTKYGLRYLAEKNGLRVVVLAPTCGLWATLAQRLVDTIVFTYAARWPRLAVKLLGVALAPVLLVGFALEQLVGPVGDTLDHVLVAMKPNEP